jgi:hypothetical protein
MTTRVSPFDWRPLLTEGEVARLFAVSPRTVPSVGDRRRT